jgi:RNA polymerase sigma-70 factor (ECF subfamily)
MRSMGLALTFGQDYSIPTSAGWFLKSESDTADEGIVGRVRNGDTEAFGILVRKYEDFVFTLTKGLTSSADSAGDVTQETFLRAYKAIRRFEKKASFKTWLYRIAYNTALNHIKRRKHEIEFEEAHEKIPTGADSDEIAIRATMKQLIDRLKPEHKAILILHYYDDLKYEEIAEVSNCPVGTVKIRLFRAKYELKKLWEKYAI